MTRVRTSDLLLISALLITLPLLTWGALVFVSDLNPLNRDFFKFWLAARLILEGGDPQLTSDWLAGHERYGSTWLPEGTSLYPLPLALLLAPLGLLPLEMAFVLCIALTILLALASVALTMRIWPQAIWLPYVLPLIAATLLFRPLLITLWLGQLSGLFLISLALAGWCWERGRWLAGGVALALLMLKPSLGAPLIALLGIWMLVQHRHNAILGLSGGMLGLLLLGMLRSPDWPLRFLAIGSERASSRLGTTPNLWGLGTLACGHDSGCIGAVGGALSAVTLIVAAMLLWRTMTTLSPYMAICWAAPLALLVTPYTYAYDQLILLVPTVIITLTFAKHGAPFLATALIPLGLSAVALLCSIPGEQVGHDIASIGVPLAVLAAAMLTPQAISQSAPPALL